MSFAEILVIAVVVLVIVGPERLPETIRTGMLWFGRLKRSINETKTEFEKQLGVDEVRRELHNEQVVKSLKALESSQRKLAQRADDFDDDLQKKIKKIENGIDDPVHHDDHEPVTIEHDSTADTADDAAEIKHRENHSGEPSASSPSHPESK